MFDDANPRRYRTVLARELVHNHRTRLESPVRRAPRTIGIGWTGLLGTTPMLHADASQVEQIALRVCDKKPLVSLRAEYGGRSSAAAVHPANSTP
jgi:hypothetical protein